MQPTGEAESAPTLMERVADRVDIWKTARGLLRELGAPYYPQDVINLSNWLMGEDDLWPLPLDEPDDDEDSD